MLPDPTRAKAWETLAERAADLDPGATITDAVYAAAVAASSGAAAPTVPAPGSLKGPAITLPELPLLWLGSSALVGYAALAVDAAAIFGARRRCLHDRIAGTFVVSARPIASP
jgi:hypothetical protein